MAVMQLHGSKLLLRHKKEKEELFPFFEELQRTDKVRSMQVCKSEGADLPRDTPKII